MGLSVYLWERPEVLFVVEEAPEADRVLVRVKVPTGAATGPGSEHPPGRFAGWAAEGKMRRVA